MSTSHKMRRLHLRVESLEGRAVPSQLGALPLSGAQAALVGQALRGRIPGGIAVDPAGVSAISSALRGGPGSEFATLLRRQVPNIGRVVSDFASGRRGEFSTPGFAVKLPKLQPAYAGPEVDQLNPTAAGAILQPDGDLLLGAILRGPIDQARPSYYVFGIDRGSAPASGPFAGRPGIRFDATVTVAWNANGPGVSASVTDTSTGSVTPIDPARVSVAGPTLRVNVPGSALPSRGLAPRDYRFAFWTRSGLDGGLEQVGSFVPDAGTIPVGILQGRTRRR